MFVSLAPPAGVNAVLQFCYFLLLVQWFIRCWARASCEDGTIRRRALSYLFRNLPHRRAGQRVASRWGARRAQGATVGRALMAVREMADGDGVYLDGLEPCPPPPNNWARPGRPITGRSQVGRSPPADQRGRGVSLPTNLLAVDHGAPPRRFLWVRRGQMGNVGDDGWSGGTRRGRRGSYGERRRRGGVNNIRRRRRPLNAEVRGRRCRRILSRCQTVWFGSDRGWRRWRGDVGTLQGFGRVRAQNGLAGSIGGRRGNMGERLD
jgi:hypothetical protein